MKSISTRLYSQLDFTTWNHFIDSSLNGTFLFNRNFLDYHKNRFQDFSLMVFEGDELISCVPGSSEDDSWFSHKGLTYGGIIIDRSLNVIELGNIVESISEYLQINGFRNASFKLVPSIFRKDEIEKELFSLLTNNFSLIGFDLWQYSNLLFPMDSKKIRGANTALKRNYNIEFTRSNISDLFRIINENLEIKYSRKAVHSHQEMNYLLNLFPENIFIMLILKNKTVEGGAVCFKTNKVIHVQYLATTAQAKLDRAQDLLMLELRDFAQKYDLILSLGSSTENLGKVVNQGLIKFKDAYCESTCIGFHLSKEFPIV